MLATLKRLFRRAQTAATIDPWSGSGCYYVARYRSQLDSVATELMREHVPKDIRTRFNAKFGRAELCTPYGDIVAVVRVEGECCSPTNAKVFADVPEEAKALFEKMLPLPVRFVALSET